MNQVTLSIVLLKHQQDFHPVVPFIPYTDILLFLDFTKGNNELNDTIISDTNVFTNYITDKLSSTGAKYGIGGYNEHRIIYSRSSVFDPRKPGDEPRRLHLGIDVWGQPYTKVMSPSDGIIHSFGYYSETGNYGGVIIITHQLEGISFYTLYGHLSRNSITNVSEGERIKKGDVIGEFGIPLENGSWPPHLHFQIIQELGEWKGDYPGVCGFSEKEKYLQNCPDPDFILQLNQYL